MRKIMPIIVEVISYFFILLFIYASASKMLDFENFQVQLAQSPLLSAYAGFISYAVIIIEVMIAGVLADPKVRRIGLYASFGLMVAFTVYIFLILNYSDFIPCSCGGILEKMSWDEHLIFNIVCVVLALTASVFMGKERAHGWSRIAAAALIAVFSAGSIGALFLSSEYIMKKENNFTRRFLPNFLIEKEAVDLSKDGYYFAGIDDKNLYLGNRFKPLFLREIDLKTISIQDKRLYPNLLNYHFKNIEIKVKGSFYYVYDGTVPIIYRGKLGDSTPERISYDDAYFSQLAVIDTSRFAIRTQSSTTHFFTLGLLDLNQHKKVNLFPSALGKQRDGIFDSDGQLIENQSKSQQALYMFLYRNEFMMLKEGDIMIHSQKTIDNTTKAELKITTLSDGTKKLEAPPLKVNSGIGAYGDFVFVISEIRGKHEPPGLRKNRKAVDIYNTSKNEYYGSFYIPQRKVDGLMVNQKFLYVLSGKTIYRYEFRKSFVSGEAENLSKE